MAAESFKICSICGIKKSIDDFYKRKGYKGRKARIDKQCKACVRKSQKKNYKDRIKKDPKYNHKKYKEASKKSDYKMKQRNNYYKHYYNITIEDYDVAYNKQRGCCAICGKHQSELSTRLCVDHDHKTNEFRGLLCVKCNGALGWHEKFEFEITSYLKG